VAYLGEVLTDPLTKKTVPDYHHHGGLQQHPQEGLQSLSVQARGGRWYQGRFYTIKQIQYPTKQFGAVSLCCYSYLSCYHHFYFNLKTGVNTLHAVVSHNLSENKPTPKTAL
jgi:hypothetical protein